MQMRTQDHTNSETRMLPFHLALMICQCLHHPRFPYLLFPQTIFPTVLSLRRVPPVVAEGFLSIFISQTVQPSCHHELIRDTVSAMHVSLARILSSRDKHRQKHSQMIMTFVQLGVGGGAVTVCNMTRPDARY